jgi:alpha-beta hydrolase superfamily lysophospholipase
MSASLPVVDPAKIPVPTLVMRGQWDGIATLEDVNAFFLKLPHPDKQLTVMQGIAHSSMRSQNWRMVYHLLDAWFSRPAAAYTG